MRIAAFPKDVATPDREFYQAAGNAGYVFLSGDNEQADGLFSQLFERYPSALNLHYFYGFLLFPHDPGLAIDQFRSELARCHNSRWDAHSPKWATRNAVRSC